MAISDDLGISLRQLQCGFTVIGSTPTKYLTMKRIEHFQKHIDRRAEFRDDWFDRNYTVSYRDLEEIMAEYGIEVDHAPLWRPDGDFDWRQ